LAAKQHGVVAHWQLPARGIGRGLVERRLESGRWQAVHLGVYSVGHAPLTARGRWMAAVLACGAEAVLSHQSAAALWGIRGTSRAVIDVTVPARGRKNRRRIAVHRVRTLHAEDRGAVDGIPVTSVPRTLLDLAEVVAPRALERVFEEAERLRVLDLRAVQSALDRSHGRRGARALRALVAEYRDEPPPTRSELERDFLDLCRDAGLPRPAVNARVGEYEVDMLWRSERLVVEIDGRGFHQARAAFERDRRRDAQLQVDRYRVVRITYRRLTREPRAVADMIGRLLEA
jgi:very-short-patch-repair endonuclease/predicted transcriptional regulator of viral defense system